MMCHIIASQRMFLAGSAVHGRAGAVLLAFTDKIILVQFLGEESTVKHTRV